MKEISNSEISPKDQERPAGNQMHENWHVSLQLLLLKVSQKEMISWVYSTESFLQLHLREDSSSGNFPEDEAIS